MIRAILAAGTAATAALLLVAAGFGEGKAVPALQGTVGPGFTIKLSKGGKQVKSLQPGTYRFVIADNSPEHNFMLKRGAQVRQLTSVPFTGKKTITIKLAKGTWTFFCAPHASEMRGSFAVGQRVTQGASATNTGTATTPTTTVDDHGGHGEPEPGDDHGGHGEPEHDDGQGHK